MHQAPNVHPKKNCNSDRMIEMFYTSQSERMYSSSLSAYDV